MQIKELGHVVLKVRNLGISVPFYRDVLGLQEVARYGEQMVFFSQGARHHDLALLELGSDAPAAPRSSPGLYHIAFKIGESTEELRACKKHLQRHGVRIIGMTDHKVSQSIYIMDPDGIEIELYVDADPRIWAHDPGAVATVEPLDL